MRPRIRTIKPELWQDEKITALPRDARLLLLGLVTMADDEGRLRARRSTILGHVFPNDDDAPRQIDDWIATIREQKLILFYLVDGTPYAAFRHWARHQKINRPTPSDLPPPPNRRVVRENGLVEIGKGWRQAHGALTEEAMSAHGNGTESSGSAHSPPRERAFRSDPDPILVLCQRLATHIRSNDPKADPNPESERWRREMRLLLTARKGDVEEVERIIDWCQTDSFWHSNILSPTKLRAQFTQLVLKAKKGQVIPISDAREERRNRGAAALDGLMNRAREEGVSA
jgi:hypothetical protein